MRIVIKALVIIFGLSLCAFFIIGLWKVAGAIACVQGALSECGGAK